jgi:hypothetical protein
MDTEAADYLADYKHIIVRTSDKENPYKYRIILESDIEIDLNDQQYKQLLGKISDELPFDVDLLPRAQIYFGYADREAIILSDAEQYPVSSLMKHLDKEREFVRVLSSEKLQRAWDDRLILFKWFYAINDDAKRVKLGHHQTLWLATKYGHDIGVDYNTMVAILDDIIDFRGLETRPEYRDELVNGMKKYKYYKDTFEGVY